MKDKYIKFSWRIKNNDFLVNVSDVLCIKINHVNIPHLIEAGSTKPIILDCDYDLGSSSTKDLVVKWYIDQDLLYQWIFNKEHTGSDEFKKYIDTSYKASNDPKTMYRAVKLVKPGHELSGNVKCKISTLFEEVERVKRMLVYCEYDILPYSCFITFWREYEGRGILWINTDSLRSF